MDTPEILLSVNELHVGYGTKQILFGIDFEVAKGEAVTFLGANGSGKSTSLNNISGFVSTMSGKVMFEGQDITDLSAHEVFRLGIVQVSQARDLFPDLTVEHNLRLGAAVRNRNGIEEQLERVFYYFPRLLERRKQHTRTLSGGEQQMVAIGRAIMSEPKLLLLDEPSGGLSPQFVNEIGTIIKALKDDGATMLMVEQNLSLAFKVADRFIILRDGLVSDGGFVKGLEDNHDEIVRQIYL